MAANKVIRTKKNGCFRETESASWGKYLLPIDDPEGIDIKQEELEGIRLNKNFPKIPADLWTRFIKLAFHYCPEKEKDKKTDDLEVSIVLLRNMTNLNEWKIVVPTQEVSGASVEAKFEKNCDIATGEEYTQFPPNGWVHAGSAHSHNHMSAFFSGTDDENELGVPGAHIVVGKLDPKKESYEYSASVVLQRNRKMVKDLDLLVEDGYPNVTFHPNVLNYIKVKEYKMDMMPPWAKYFRGRRGNNQSVLDDIDKSLAGEDFDLDLDKMSEDEDAIIQLLDEIPDTDDPGELVQAWWTKITSGNDEIPEPTDQELENIAKRGEDK